MLLLKSRLTANNSSCKWYTQVLCNVCMKMYGISSFRLLLFKSRTLNYWIYCFWTATSNMLLISNIFIWIWYKFLYKFHVIFPMYFHMCTIAWCMKMYEMHFSTGSTKIFTLSVFQINSLTLTRDKCDGYPVFRFLMLR